MMNDAKKFRRKLVNSLRMEGVKDQRILNAFMEIPRELFVLESHPGLIYSDIVLITYKKNGKILSTSSQPSLMARIMEDMEIKEGEKVLEIGSGTGYNAAILSKVVGKDGVVVTIENDEELSKIAQKNIEKLGLKNVICVCKDGYYGFEEYSLYDKIFVTVGVDEPGVYLFNQLKINGMIGFPMNLYAFSWNPYFIMKKINERTLKGKVRFDTSFLKAGGKFAWRKKLLDDMMKSREEYDHISNLYISRLSYSQLELLEICSLRLFRQFDYVFIDLEKRGYAILKEKFNKVKVMIYGYEGLIEDIRKFMNILENKIPNVLLTYFLMHFENEIPEVEPSLE